jgi:hypothetical protein
VNRNRKKIPLQGKYDIINIYVCFRWELQDRNNDYRIQGARGSRIQWKGMEVKTLEPSNPGILGPYFLIIHLERNA